MLLPDVCWSFPAVIGPTVTPVFLALCPSVEVLRIALIIRSPVKGCAAATHQFTTIKKSGPPAPCFAQPDRDSVVYAGRRIQFFTPALFGCGAGYWSGSLGFGLRRIKLWSCLSELYVRLEHVGSVSLPALYSQLAAGFQLRRPVLNYIRLVLKCQHGHSRYVCTGLVANRQLLNFSAPEAHQPAHSPQR